MAPFDLDAALAEGADLLRAEQYDTALANEVESRLADKAEDELRAGESWIADQFRELKLANEQAVEIAALSVTCSELPEAHEAHERLSKLVDQAKRDALDFRRATFTPEERREIEREITDEWAEA